MLIHLFQVFLQVDLRTSIEDFLNLLLRGKTAEQIGRQVLTIGMLCECSESDFENFAALARALGISRQAVSRWGGGAGRRRSRTPGRAAGAGGGPGTG